jgi:hypothetical protein
LAKLTKFNQTAKLFSEKKGCAYLTHPSLSIAIHKKSDAATLASRSIKKAYV